MEYWLCGYRDGYWEGIISTAHTHLPDFYNKSLGIEPGQIFYLL